MVNMKDIAKAAAVSQTTVSLILNDRYGNFVIPDTTRKRIKKVAAEMGYRLDAVAQSMATGKTKILAYVATEDESEYSAKILSGAMREARRWNYLVKPITQSYGDWTEIIDILLSQRPDGVIFRDGSQERFEVLQAELKRNEIPIVVVDEPGVQSEGIAVFSDEEVGMKEALQHLRSLGHEAIAFLGGFETCGAGANRKRALLAAAESLKIGIDPKWLFFAIPGQRLFPQFHSLARRILTIKAGPTAVLCESDLTAMTLLAEADDLGIRIPEQMSVIGFADLLMAQFSAPPLTTIAQDFIEMGVSAARELLTLLVEGKEPELKLKKLNTRLIVRRSTGPLGARAGS